MSVLINFSFAQQNQKQNNQTDSIKHSEKDNMPIRKADTNVVHPKMQIQKPKSHEPMPVKKLSDTIK
jgi:hypothetical protein